MASRRSRTLLLASQSPRRRQILSFFSIPYKVVKPVGVDETPHRGELARHLSRRLALDKARRVARLYPRQLVIGADTVVTYQGRIFGKPKNEKDAERMLRSLRGKRHSVYTGVALVWASRKIVTSHVEETRVSFGGIPNAELKAYLKTSEPYDKAGAYAIQGTAGKWIKKWEGDYFNVMGLPVQWLLRQLSILLY